MTMEKKTYLPEREEEFPASQIGATLEALAKTIAQRKNTVGESYTHALLVEDQEVLLGKVLEESAEVAEAARLGNIDHIRYEIGDVVYHLMVVLERHEISLEELAAELNMRMQDQERPSGGILLYDEFVNRGK